MVRTATTNLDTDLSLFKYDNLEQLPESYRSVDEVERGRRIADAKAELGDDLVILGHNHQRREVVERADFVGDSYQLSTEAAASDAEHVVFAGVTFMAESADVITDDEQTVLLPSMEASRPMAGMAEALRVDAAWAELADAVNAARASDSVAIAATRKTTPGLRGSRSARWSPAAATPTDSTSRTR